MRRPPGGRFRKLSTRRMPRPIKRPRRMHCAALSKRTTNDKLADLNKAVELQPKKPDYLRLRAQQLYEKEKYDDALDDADKALKMEPDHAATNELRGMILLGLGQIRRCAEELRQSERAGAEESAALRASRRALSPKGRSAKRPSSSSTRRSSWRRITSRRCSCGPAFTTK